MQHLQPVCLCVLYLLITVCGYQSGYDENIDTVYVDQSPGNDYERFPASYSVGFEYQGLPYHYNLQRDDGVTAALNPSIFKLSPYLPDDVMTDDNGHEFAYYHNGEPTGTEQRACFVLHRQSADQKASVYGQFRDDGDKYLIQHLADDEHSVRRDVGVRGPSHSRRRREINEGETNVIEILVWSAPDLFKFHRSRLSTGGKETEEFLRVWEKAIIRDVDITFRTVTATPFRAYFLQGGNDRDSGVSWYSDNTRGGTMREDALPAVSDYLANLVQSDVLPFFDHAVVLTREDLADNFRGTNNDKIAFGQEDSICGYPPGSSVSIAEVSSPYFTKAVTQSILFAFGLKYTTSDSDKYTVMSRELLVDIPDANQGDRWLVDSRNERLLKRKIDGLLFNCLLVQTGNFDFSKFLSTPTYGGTYTRVRDQCRIFAGAFSRECMRMDTVCYNGVMCTDVNGDCTLDYFTGDRTPCLGSTDSCRYGQCSFNEVSTTTTTTLFPPTTRRRTTTTTTTPQPTTTVTTMVTDQNTRPPTTKNPIGSTVKPTDCCCERRPLGKVVIKMEYVPCNSTSTRYFYRP